MVDLLGPADAGAINTLTTTSDVTSPVVGDSWNKDCVGGVSGTGTPEVAKYMNRMLQQMRVAIRASNVPVANSYDNMLSWAMQSGYANWAGDAGGSANALTGTVDNAPLTITTGTVVSGLATANNTGATTYNLDSLGADPVKDLWGNALVGGEILNGALFRLQRVASHWRLISPYPDVDPPDFDPFSDPGIGALIVCSGICGGASDVAPNAMPGSTGSWAGIGTGFHGIAPGGHTPNYIAADARWPSTTPPAGVWELVTLSLIGSNAYGAVGYIGNLTGVLRRIS